MQAVSLSVDLSSQQHVYSNCHTFPLSLFNNSLICIKQMLSFLVESYTAMTQRGVIGRETCEQHNHLFEA